LHAIYACMSSFVVSARKYRPADFDSVVGQPSVSNTLKNAIRTGQVAHAYLFCGPRGVGKTTCARIFAKALNCFNLSENMEPCGTCESCRSFSDGRSFNIHELDAASNNSVDDIRSLIDKVRILPQVGRYSIYIIDEVHMLSQSAFNAFLKTLEEPPAHAIFILATTEKHKIIPTILSRCQIFDFHRISVEDITARLVEVAKNEHIQYEEDALNIIALKADGAMRDALSIFDQVASFSQRNITYAEVIENLNVLDYEYFFRLTEDFLNRNATGVMLLYNEILQRGFDGMNFLGGLASHFRDLLVCRDESTLKLLEVSDSLKARYRNQAGHCDPDFLFRALEICSQCELSYKAARNPRLHVEIALIRLCNVTGEKKKPAPELEPLVIPVLAKPGSNTPPATPAPPVPSAPVTAPTPASAPSPAPAAALQEKEPAYQPPVRISIREALKGAGNGNTEPAKEMPGAAAQPATPQNRKPVSEAFLQMCWNAYADQIKAERPRMAVTLKSVKPTLLGETRVGITLNNRDQLEDFMSHTKPALEVFLRREMQNDLLEIEAGLDETVNQTQVRLYTSEEKFKYLSDKNPLLNKLRQNLNLEIE
jgi:DNA polymerase III subunit gamma/tau